MNRRRFLYAGSLAGCVVPFGGRAFAASRGGPCALTPEQEEGPFYLPGEHVRSAIAEGHAGLPLALDVRVLDAATCAPLARAAVDVWQCDALGRYAGFAETAGAGPPPFAGGHPPPFPGGHPPFGAGPPPHGPPPGGPGRKPDLAQTFLRGIQVTGASGDVRFATIFPGFYVGRVNHIHLKVHVLNHRAARANDVVHTGQIFFPEAIAAAVSAQQPYARHHIRRTTLAEDGVFMQQNGSATRALLERTRIDGREGYRASITVSVNVNATTSGVRRPAG